VPLTLEEYGCLKDFSVLFSGGLDSTAVPLVVGPRTDGEIHLLTFKHGYGTFFNEWSRKHVPELVDVLGPRVFHDIVDLTEIWNEIGFKRMLQDFFRYRANWVCCLGCQESMAAYTIAYNLERNISNTLICSSVGGEYAVMSMNITREKNAGFYARYGVRYNAPLLDLGISKPEEREVLAQHGILPGWGARRSHNGFQPICVLGFQHAFDVVLDAHTTYDAEQVSAFLDDKFEIMDRIIRRILTEKGLDPDACIAKNLEQFQREEDAIAELRYSI
jgi:hypothetical protein